MNTGHLNTGLVKVWYSDVSLIQIPTVSLQANSEINFTLGCKKTTLYNRGLCSQMPFPGNWIFPEKIREISPKNLGNFPSRALGNILFPPVPTQYWHSGLASSRLVSGREFLNASRMKKKINFKACKDFPDQYRLVNQIHHSPILSQQVLFYLFIYLLGANQKEHTCHKSCF